MTHSEPTETSPNPLTDPLARKGIWDSTAVKMDSWRGWGGYYHRRLLRVYRHLIAPGQRVLEVGCGQGDLLAALDTARGVGIDFSGEMIKRARERHPDLEFIEADAHEFEIEGEFDVIILSDLVNDVIDVQNVFERVAAAANPSTRIILNLHSQAWRPVLSLARWMGLAKPLLPQNWLTREDVGHLLFLADVEVIRSWQEVLCPLPVPLLGWFANHFLAKLWPFRHAALSNFILARPAPVRRELPTEPLVSVIVAARNEAGNIASILERVPEMGGGTEVVFVEGGSTDDTYAVIEREIAKCPEKRYKLFKQPGKGKGDAVRVGFEQASGEVLMILDADLTVPPEDLPRFYEALRSGKADFVNGVRLVYPMEKRAMRFFNLLGNKFFSMAFSWLLEQPIKDTLCGTKVLWKSDYERIAANRSYFGEFDPFGDYDLIFGAVKQNFKIVDLPVRYRERVYGDTNIQRWRHGVVLLRMVIFAAKRIKFV